MPQRLLIFVKYTAASNTTNRAYKALKNAPMNNAPRVLSTGIGGAPPIGVEGREGDMVVIGVVEMKEEDMV